MAFDEYEMRWLPKITNAEDDEVKRGRDGGEIYVLVDFYQATASRVSTERPILQAFIATHLNKIIQTTHLEHSC